MRRPRKFTSWFLATSGKHHRVSGAYSPFSGSPSVIAVLRTGETESLYPNDDHPEAKPYLLQRSKKRDELYAFLDRDLQSRTHDHNGIGYRAGGALATGNVGDPKVTQRRYLSILWGTE